VDVSFSEALAVAKEAAAKGAEIVATGYRDQDLAVDNKGLINLVTKYDLASERSIRSIIGEAFPDHDILAEENGLNAAGLDRPRWYVDPLDGTTNFVHRHPFFSVSVALALPNGRGFWEPAVGVVHAPILGERRFAVRGEGAYREVFQDGAFSNPEKMTVSPARKLVEALVNTGFPYDVHSRVREIVAPLERMLGQVQAIRRSGAASLDLAFVANGRAEGYFEASLKPWDVAAGILLVKEAGGEVTDRNGDEYVLEKSDYIIASNGFLHQKFVEIVKG
jgi:myo-inositol-1(or 4)-monophosphatase